MSRSAPYHVALIGFGLAGEFFHAPLIACTEGLRLATIVTRDAARAERARTRFPGVRIVDRPDALWSNASAHRLVVVATPNRTHVPLAREAIRAGIAVVVDKPFAPTAAEARALDAEARERHVPLTVYHNRRWDGDFLTLQRLLDDGRLGDVHRFESRFERWRPTPKPGWRLDADPASAGGVLYDLGSHLVDQALALFGAAREVYAELDSRFAGVDVDDDAFVAIVHRSGTRSHLWASTVAAAAGPRFRVLGSLAAYTRHGLDVQEMALRGGAAAGGPGWGEEPADRWGRLGTGDDEQIVRTQAGDYGAFYRAMVGVLDGTSDVPVQAAEAADVIAVLEAARRSARSRDVVTMSADYTAA